MITIISTKWLIFNPTGVIDYDFSGNDAYAINSYTITTANDAPNRDPKNWTLQGSNTGLPGDWANLDTRNNQFENVPRYHTITYNNFNNTTAYKYYRLNVTANWGDNLLQIAEIQMFGPAGSGGGGCTTPNPPSISSSSTTSPADLTATGCSGSITWSNGQTANPLTNVGGGGGYLFFFFAAIAVGGWVVRKLGHQIQLLLAVVVVEIALLTITHNGFTGIMLRVVFGFARYGLTGKVCMPPRMPIQPRQRSPAENILSIPGVNSTFS
ncbi:MAG: hypothetical protein U5N85_18955 [Arcicella sp.]|nr:hypothetical protein [Arcicella sp.]